MSSRLELLEIVADCSEALKRIDSKGVKHKNFRPGIGPFGEPQLVRMLIEDLLNVNPSIYWGIRTKRLPDVLIPGQWAIEFKIVRPFGDNGKQAEHWSENMLHPYESNVSLLGDCLKLCNWVGSERKSVIAITFEHDTPRIDLNRLVSCFEVLAKEVLELQLGRRQTSRIDGLVHPVHQSATIHAWELQK